MTVVPQNWVVVPIVDVLEPNENGKPFQQGWSPQCENHPASEDRWGVLKTTAIQAGQFWDHQNKQLPSGLDPRPHFEVRAGDLLMTCAGPRSRCGVVCLVERTREKLMMSGKMYRFRANAEVVEARYLAYFIQSRSAQLAIDRMKTGISDSGLNLTHDRFSNLAVNLPPLPEQRRIIDKIEELFSELDKGVESLTTARMQLSAYRKSVLKNAFEGKLTADWRAKNPDKLEAPDALLSRIKKEREYQYTQALNNAQADVKKWRAASNNERKPARPKPLKEFPTEFHDLRVTLPKIPTSWVWAHLGWCSLGPEYGTAAKSSETGKVPVVRMGNLQGGRIVWDDLVYTSDENEIAQYSLRAGDVLFNRTNSPELVGKTSIYRGERPALFAGYLVRVNQIETIAVGKYLTYYLSSPIAREHGNAVKTDGVNQSNINGTKLQEYPFPFCSVAEQVEIIQILDANLEAADVMEAEIESGLARANVFRQSILKRAFSGQLVAQDPADEPPSELLERIRAEREEDGTKKRRNYNNGNKEAA